ncbi:hypothetical protein HYW76_01380 [Candidatus Pacearchaeota archaeon]|nr:hypothetical protein [Candidatus Pacearchaeota archaeon]
MKKREIILGIALILAVILILVIILRNNGGNSKIECEKDEDCVRQQVGCCSCEMGGEERCMSRENASYWQGKLSECENNLFCTAMYNCNDNSCRCVEGKCE